MTAMVSLFSVYFVLLTVLAGLPPTGAFAPSAPFGVSTNGSSSTTATALSIGQLLSDFLPASKASPAIADPQRIEEIKSEIKALAKGTSNGITASDDVRQ